MSYFETRLFQELPAARTTALERAAEDGRIAPEHPFGSHTPPWNLEKLEANERVAAIRGGRLAWQNRLLAELTVATRDQASPILHRYKDQIDALPTDEHDKPLAAAQEIIAEKTN